MSRESRKFLSEVGRAMGIPVRPVVDGPYKLATPPGRYNAFLDGTRIFGPSFRKAALPTWSGLVVGEFDGLLQLGLGLGNQCRGLGLVPTKVVGRFTQRHLGGVQVLGSAGDLA